MCKKSEDFCLTRWLKMLGIATGIVIIQITVIIFMCLAQYATVEQEEGFLQSVLILANIATHNVLVPAIYFVSVLLLFWYTQEAQAMPIEDESLAFGKLRPNVNEDHMELDELDEEDEALSSHEPHQPEILVIDSNHDEAKKRPDEETASHNM